jgi:hypothetical protein
MRSSKIERLTMGRRCDERTRHNGKEYDMRHLKLAAFMAITVAILTSPLTRAWASDYHDHDQATQQRVVAPEANVLGMSYGDWSAAWWQYYLLFTNDISPYNDSTGARCGDGQSDSPAFFLVGGPADISRDTCTVPAGKILVVPIINAECSTLEDPPFHGSNEQELRRCAATFMNVNLKSLFMTIDGVKVKDLQLYRAQSPLFTFWLPTDPNNAAGKAGNGVGLNDPPSGMAVADGYWIILNPLPRGKHVLHFGASADTPTGPNVQDVTYILTVK